MRIAHGFNTLGVVYYRLGRWQDAIDSLNKSAKGNAAKSVDAWDLFFLAMSHQRQGDTVQARAAYERAIVAKARLPQLTADE